MSSLYHLLKILVFKTRLSFGILIGFFSSSKFFELLVKKDLKGGMQYFMHKC